MNAITGPLALPAAPSSAQPSAISLRRHDLDWLRIIAFGLLILYHMGMFFVTWDWHVKSAHAGPTIQPLMVLTSPWRLSLLFLIAGVATRFMADKLPRTAMLRARSYRLLLPLAFGMLVVVPPQTWCEITEKLGWDGSIAEFYRLYVTGYDGWRPAGRHLIVPTWNHLWFLPYLWVYTMIVIAARPLLQAPALGQLGAGFGALLGETTLVLLPGLLLLVLRLGLRPAFPETHALLDDWYLHAEYFALFLFGYAIARSRAVWAAIGRLRWPALAVALLCWGALAWGMYRGLAMPPAVRDVLWSVDQWAWILLLLGFAPRLLDHDNAARRWLTDAVFPFYILHQTVIVVAGHLLRPYGLPALTEAGIIFILTVTVCIGGYEAVRRTGWLRPCFGLKRLA